MLTQNAWELSKRYVKLLTVICSGVLVPEGSEIMAQVGERMRYWETAEHQSLKADLNVDQLLPLLNEYELVGDSFPQRNEFAFRIANFESHSLWARLCLISAEPDLMDRHGEALVHLASAAYTRLRGPLYFSTCLADNEEQVGKGALILAARMQSLNFDGSDQAWPSGKSPDPKILPQRISRILLTHPELGRWVAGALEAYGPLAASEVRLLVPLLVSDDAEAAHAAADAIRKLAPDVAKKLELQDGSSVTAEQKQRIREYLSTESDKGSSTDNQYTMLQFESLMQHLENDPEQLDQVANTEFTASWDPVEWWPVLNAAALDIEFREFHGSHGIHRLAAAFCGNENSRQIIRQTLTNDDPRTVGSMIDFVSLLRLQRLGSSSYFGGDLLDPHLMPALFMDALKRHPELVIYVARGLASYQEHAKRQSEGLVPYLLSEDPVVVWEVRRALTAIDVDLASKLGCELELLDYQFFLGEAVEAEVLDDKQRKLVNAHLETVSVSLQRQPPQNPLEERRTAPNAPRVRRTLPRIERKRQTAPDEQATD